MCQYYGQNMRSTKYYRFKISNQLISVLMQVPHLCDFDFSSESFASGRTADWQLLCPSTNCILIFVINLISFWYFIHIINISTRSLFCFNKLFNGSSKVEKLQIIFYESHRDFAIDMNLFYHCLFVQHTTSQNNDEYYVFPIDQAISFQQNSRLFYHTNQLFFHFSK